MLVNFTQYYGLDCKGKEDHREIIDKYSKDGWRFVTAIPLPSGNQVITEFDLVFEKEE